MYVYKVIEAFRLAPLRLSLTPVRMTIITNTVEKDSILNMGKGKALFIASSMVN